MHKLLKFNKVKDAENIIMNCLQQYVEEIGGKKKSGYQWPKNMIKVRLSDDNDVQ